MLDDDHETGLHEYSPLGRLTGREPTPGLRQLLTHSHLSLKSSIRQFASSLGRACATSHQTSRNEVSQDELTTNPHMYFKNNIF